MPVSSAKGRDDLVMATNNSSIVSKRSVERIYLADEPQFYRFFVKKFQRRAPLINRGYHLRLLLIDVVVRQFLARQSPKPKVVVNLGCGSDVLPWRTMSRYASNCHGVKFVDIDFPDVMMAKRHIVEQTSELRDPLTNLEFPGDPHLLLRSDEYYQIASDLRQISTIDQVLSQIIAVEESEFLFVAEVSITYMDPKSADALISWASKIGNADFCLLEQILPDGTSNPFARTMLQHFEKLNTPLKCISKYPTVRAQEERFNNLGWCSTQSWTMWEAWEDPYFQSSSDREHLDTLEVFDEWEEFVSFASHYFLLCASTDASRSRVKSVQHTNVQHGVPVLPINLVFSPSAQAKNTAARRFGAPLVIEDHVGQKFLANFFGLGSEGRPRSCDLYTSHNIQNTSLTTLHHGGPAARMCFTLTDLGDAGYLLAGGRSSPAGPFKDSWLFKKDTNQWSKTHDLPQPLYRHSVTRLGESKIALLSGGKLGSSQVFSGSLLYHPISGWVECKVKGSLKPPPLFGAILQCTGTMQNPYCFHGVFAGGMSSGGIIQSEAYRWILDVSNLKEPTICFEHKLGSSSASLLSRFGASSVSFGGWAVIIGGVTGSGSALYDAEIVRYHVDENGAETINCLEFTTKLGIATPRPVLIGASAVIAAKTGEIAVIGGGMTCFSMGTVASQGVYTFNPSPSASDNQGTETPQIKAWQYWKTLVIANEVRSQKGQPDPQQTGPEISPIRRIKLASDEEFQKILENGKPVVFEGLDLGSCISKWNPDYLAEQNGPDHKVVVHESASQAMDFLSKNFRYTTQTFKEFASKVAEGKKLYMRALSADKPSDLPARLDMDFPALAADFALPPQLNMVQENLFSSVLRISGPVTMWLHYDVLANVYCQIQGSKRFFLFPPSDVTQLGFSPGASSSSIDVFSSLAASSLPNCRPYEAVVEPGDVLFLPQLWLHTATPLSSSSIAVNVFFRDLKSGYSKGRDVYGNRDLAAYEKARQDISKISNAFKDLPRDTREFYLGRIADELHQMAAE